MPLQHVLETARRLGIPVVITNEAGEAAQVVMPFEDFAAMVGAASPAPRASRPRVTHVPVEVPQHDQDEIAQALADLRMEEIQMEDVHSIERPSSASKESAAGSEEGFLEDKFYLEPLEDGESTK